MSAAAGIEEACPQGNRRPVARGEEATRGAPAARSHPARWPRTSPESPFAAQKTPKIAFYSLKMRLLPVFLDKNGIKNYF